MIDRRQFLQSAAKTTLLAGAALFASELVNSLSEGVKLARATLREGKAGRKLSEVVECTRA